METVMAGFKVNVTEDGYLTDFSQWTNKIGFEIAKEHSIEMTDQHWKVIEYLQEKYNKKESLSIRGIKKSGIINIKEFYSLFPGGPLKISTMIAGIPKPVSCI